MAGRSEVVQDFLRDLPRHKAAPAMLVVPAASVLRHQTSPSKTYVPTHSTDPPKDQVVKTEKQNVLVREFKAKQGKTKQQRDSPSAASNARGKKRKSAM